MHCQKHAQQTTSIQRAVNLETISNKSVMASRISYREGYMASLKSNLRLFFLSNAYKCSGLVCGKKMSGV